MSVTFSFRLPSTFLDGYRDKPVPWGFKDAGGNSFGELVMIDKYSRLKEDGTKERWFEVVERVVNGTYTIQKDWARANRLPWNNRKAQASAQEMYDRIFHGLFVPPGRGLAQMGAPLVMEQRNSAPLQNCAFVSTKEMTREDPFRPFAFLMEASMLGVGVGFDLLGADRFRIYEPTVEDGDVFEIPDTREGWVESVRLLVNSYLKPGQGQVYFDYGLIRPKGAPIKTFGGTAAGHEPLHELHALVRQQFSGREGQSVTTTDLLDLGNKIGKCVVAGNVRRSAELALGLPTDKAFLQAKDFSQWNDDGVLVHQGTADARQGWGWMSNNSLDVTVGTDYTDFTDSIALNGEPGLIWMDVSRGWGRLADPKNDKDWRAAGYNPCAEQTLESFEMCTLVENFIERHETVEDFQRTLKFAYLYAKTVTLLPTHWEETNAIMQRNRRIGASLSGIATFADNRGLSPLRQWMDDGYATIQKYDRIYSEWLGVRESIKTTSVKPSGTVSLLFGVDPGVHWGPGGEYFLRAFRVAKDNPLLQRVIDAGYDVEDAIFEPDTTAVVYFPVHSSSRRSERQVSMWEKAMLAVLTQRHWADNSVSVTVSFDPEREADQIPALLHNIEGQLKTVSFLPMGNKVYAQQPYTQISQAVYESYVGRLGTIDTSVLYDGTGLADAASEAFCTNDTCAI